MQVAISMHAKELFFHFSQVFQIRITLSVAKVHAI